MIVLTVVGDADLAGVRVSMVAEDGAPLGELVFDLSARPEDRGVQITCRDRAALSVVAGENLRDLVERAWGIVLTRYATQAWLERAFQ